MCYLCIVMLLASMEKIVMTIVWSLLVLINV